MTTHPLATNKGAPLLQANDRDDLLSRAPFRAAQRLTREQRRASRRRSSARERGERAPDLTTSMVASSDHAKAPRPTLPGPTAVTRFAGRSRQLELLARSRLMTSKFFESRAALTDVHGVDALLHRQRKVRVELCNWRNRLAARS